MCAESSRVCSKCAERLPLSSFYTKRKRGLVYHQWTCKACAIAADAARRIARQEGVKLARKESGEGGYPWPPLSDLDRIALREWAYVDRTGQLRPIVKVELEKVA